jgi:hypothetical protein
LVHSAWASKCAHKKDTPIILRHYQEQWTYILVRVSLDLTPTSVSK